MKGLYAEKNQTGRYSHFDELLDAYFVKKVYRGVDTLDCVDILWNKYIPIPLDFSQSSDHKKLL